MKVLTTTTGSAGSGASADAPEVVGVVGVRGGVGTSTIARALGAHDHGTDVSGLVHGSSAVLVTSPSVSDTARLLPLVGQSLGLGMRQVVVAVVSDGHGRWPAASRARLRMVRDQVVVVPVPWVGRWRWTGTDDRVTSGWLEAMATIAATSHARPPDAAAAGQHRSRRGRWRRRRTQS